MSVLMQYLLACNVLDIVTGFIKAYDAKNVSSKKMKHGALSKVTIWCVVCLSIMVSAYLKTDLTSYVVGYYLIMEGVSILENASQFIPIPDKLKGVLDTNQVVEKPKVEKVTNVTPEMVQYIKEKEEKKNG
jgi:toxin secretion/phage lysis holin